MEGKKLIGIIIVSILILFGILKCFNKKDHIVVNVNGTEWIGGLDQDGRSLPDPGGSTVDKNLVEMRFKKRRDLLVRKCEENNDPNLAQLGPEGDHKWPVTKRKHFMMDRVFRFFKCIQFKISYFNSEAAKKVAKIYDAIFRRVQSLNRPNFCTK